MQKTGKPQTKTIVITALSLLLLVALFITAYHFLHLRGEEGAKTIQVNVTVGGETVASKEIHTDEAYLLPALRQEEGFIDGSESEFGLWVTSVNGIAADDTKQEWWALYINGALSNYGVDSTPIEDGDTVEYRLTVGYDEY